MEEHHDNDYSNSSELVNQKDSSIRFASQAERVCHSIAGQGHIVCFPFSSLAVDRTDALSGLGIQINRPYRGGMIADQNHRNRLIFTGVDAGVVSQPTELTAQTSGEQQTRAQDSFVTMVLDEAKVDTIAESADIVGNYQLLRRLGVGGMGAVWAVQQLKPVKRQVAVKLIRPELTTLQFLSRFEAERQALALMNHPNKARILEAGAKARAKEMLEQIYQDSLQRVGPLASETWIALNNLAGMEKSLGELDRAIEHHELVRDSIRQPLGIMHPHYVGSLNSLVKAYRAVGNLPWAIERLTELSEIHNERMPLNPADMMMVDRWFGIVHRDLGEATDTLPHFERVYRQSTEITQFKEAAVEWFELFAGLAEPSEVIKELPELLDNIEARCDGDSQVIVDQHRRVQKSMEENGITGIGADETARFDFVRNATHR